MTTAEFRPIAETLRATIVDFYRDRGQELSGEAGRNTLDTNSTLVERRAAMLRDILHRRAGVTSFQGLQVVDLGCGFGALSLYFAAQGARVTGLDPHEPRLAVGRAVAARHDLCARFEQGWMQRLGFPDRSFDIAIHNNSLCYVVPHEDRRLALAETVRVLRPGGWLVSRNPNRWTPLDPFTGLPFFHLLPPGSAERAYRLLRRPRSRVRLVSPPAARRELRHAGFVDIAQAGFRDGSRPDAMKWFARYQHFSARRASD